MSDAREAFIEQRRREMLTVKEYAAVQGLHQWTVYRRIWSGRQLGAVREGGQWRIDIVRAAPPPEAP